MKSRISIVILLMLSCFGISCDPDTWTISFDLNGGEGNVTSMEIEDGDEVLVENLPKGTGLTYGDYDFVGWSRSKEDGSVIKENFTPHSDITLYAQWEDNRKNHEPKTNDEDDNKKYVVTFDLNGVICEQPESKYVAANDNYLYSYNLPSVGNDGYTLEGWSQTRYGDIITDYIVVTENITLYAVWNRKTYKVSFDLNGGDGTTPNDIEFEYGNYLYYYNLPSNTDFSYTGRIFKGWSETWYGTTPIGNNIKIEGNITLYAIWEYANMVHFRINGGIGSDPDDMEVESGTILYASDLPGNTTFSKEGYIFDGWSESSSGERLNSIIINGRNTYLYAVWKPITADNIAEYINNLPRETTQTIKLTGYLSQYDLKTISSAIDNAYCEIILDLSNCNGLTEIGEEAFYNCDNLVEINIPNSVKTIGEKAFYDCGSLTSVVLPSSVTTIKKEAFYYCDKLTNIELPNSVEKIGYEVFAFCYSLENVTIPSSLQILDERAFYLCRSLRITIPYNVKALGYMALYSVNSITFKAPYNWYETYSESDWQNKQDGEAIDKLTEDTYKYYRYYYKE